MEALYFGDIKIRTSSPREKNSIELILLFDKQRENKWG
jgi:hypothetical protein